VSITSLPCTLRCLSWRLGDISHACHRPRVQEIVSEASYHLLFLRRASTPWSSFGRRGWPMSAIRAQGELRMSGKGAGELCERPCSFMHAVCVLASARSRNCHCGFRLSSGFVKRRKKREWLYPRPVASFPVRFSMTTTTPGVLVMSVMLDIRSESSTRSCEHVNSHRL
jgi:hypothetical protein